MREIVQSFKGCWVQFHCFFEASQRDFEYFSRIFHAICLPLSPFDYAHVHVWKEPSFFNCDSFFAHLVRGLPLFSRDEPPRKADERVLVAFVDRLGDVEEALAHDGVLILLLQRSQVARLLRLPRNSLLV